MSGQQHVLRALTNALDSGRIHHAFLFTGTRGVGKTTIARLFAKALNCERGVSSKPCGECSTCLAIIDAGRFVDLMEVDAASKTKIDDTRELLENVQYLPASGRYKIYLIDEVHMLSGHSFNALLKTLEEPPPHVKFLLATTDPQKLPVTVLSRCLQFNLRRLPVATIAARLAFILDAEGIAAEPSAVQLLARAGDGSLRDALSLLDQLLAFAGGAVTEEAARTMLGTVDRQQVAQLARLIAARDGAALMRYAQEMQQWSVDPAQLLESLASLFTQVALRQVVSEGPSIDEDVDPALLDELAAAIPAEDLQVLYQVALLGRRDLGLHTDPGHRLLDDAAAHARVPAGRRWRRGRRRSRGLATTNAPTRAAGLHRHRAKSAPAPRTSATDALPPLSRSHVARVGGLARPGRRGPPTRVELRVPAAGRQRRAARARSAQPRAALEGDRGQARAGARPRAGRPDPAADRIDRHRVGHAGPRTGEAGGRGASGRARPPRRRSGGQGVAGPVRRQHASGFRATDAPGRNLRSSA